MMFDPRSYRWAILALAFLSQFSANFASSVVPPLAPLLQSELGLTKAEIGVFSSATLAGSWCVFLVGGYWNERFGVRRVISLGQIVAGGFMLTMATVGTFIQAVIVMFVVGVSRGVVQPGASKAIMDWFTARERATAMGVKQTGFPISGMVLGIALPILAVALGWRLAIALVGVLVVASGVITSVFYRNPSAQGIVVSSGVDLRRGFGQLLRSPRLWALSLVACLLVTGQMGLATYLALYFSDVVLLTSIPELSSRVVVAGLFLAIMQAGGVAGRIFWGLVSDRLLGGRRMPGLAIIGAIASVMALLLAFLGPTLPVAALVVLVFMYGGTALGWNGLYHAQVVEYSGKSQSAMGVGLSMTIMQAGTVAGAPIFGYIVDVSGTYQTAWIFMSFVTLVGAAIAAQWSRTGD